MRDDGSRYNSSGRKGGNEPGQRSIKHTLNDRERGVKFEVFAYRDLTPGEVNAAIKSWMGDKKMKDLTPWRTYRIQTTIGEA